MKKKLLCLALMAMVLLPAFAAFASPARDGTQSAVVLAAKPDSYLSVNVANLLPAVLSAKVQSEPILPFARPNGDGVVQQPTALAEVTPLRSTEKKGTTQSPSLEKLAMSSHPEWEHGLRGSYATLVMANCHQEWTIV